MDYRLLVVSFVAALLVVVILLLTPSDEPALPAYENLTPETVDAGPIRVEESETQTTAREKMVEKQLAGRDIVDEVVLEVMGNVQRHEFVPASEKSSAYEDYPLPIGEGQTISQPYIVALMTQALNLSGDEKVLEIGTGSGYQAAVLAEIVDEVYTIEIIGTLASRANDTLKRLSYNNAEVKHADGYYGWEEYAPFDAIIVTAAASHVPPPLLDQLNDGGLLIIPLGSVRYHQTLTLIKKVGEDVETTYITGVRFVPMTGKVQQSTS